MRLRLGTRQSPLAKVQAAWVADQLKQHHPDLAIETVLLTTTGDQLQKEGDKKISSEGGLKALFTKEIEAALLENRIDLAVHSMKDMTPELPQGLVIGAVPLREDPRDVWISKTRTRLEDTPPYSKVATGSVRREAQLRHARPDLDIVPLRGNVDTRMKKLAEGTFDGMILALAGLKRLGREREITEILPTDLLLPAVGQGALGLEVRESDKATREHIAPLNHTASFQAITAERAFLRAMNGSCQTPMAAYATISKGTLFITGVIAETTGKNYRRAQAQGPAEQAEYVCHTLAQKLLDRHSISYIYLDAFFSFLPSFVCNFHPA